MTCGAIFDAWQRCAPDTDNRLTSAARDRFRVSRLIGVLARGSATRLNDDAGADPVSRQARLLTMNDALGRPSTRDSRQGAEEAANWKFFSQFVSDPFPVEAIDLVVSLHVEGAHAPK